MRNFVFNSLSILAGKRFARKYANTKSTPAEIDAALDLYKALRRQLPKRGLGNCHLGNHYGSRMNPWKATQGRKVATLSTTA
jgi:hypothetical protein